MRFTREDACRAWLSTAEINDDQWERLLARHGSAETAYAEAQRHGDGPLAACGLSRRQCAVLAQEAERESMHWRLLAMQQAGISMLYRDDPRFPKALRQLADPPWLLFYKGELNCLMGRHLAMVGTRKSSAYALNAALRIAQDLSENGVSIVSGMAPGIDTAAHDGCMAGPSPTIGWAGCGLERPRPLGRQDLDWEIVAHGGLVLSEFPPGSDGLPYHYPKRNRLISGMSDAVLFMEGRIRSGGMITVECALEQGKDVFAFPGPVGQEGSEGPLQILREGAILFRDAADVLSDMGWEHREPASQTLNAMPELDGDRQTVLSLLTVEELSFDQLTFRTGMEPSRLNTALTLLELQGLIAQSSGRIYHKA